LVPRQSGGADSINTTIKRACFHSTLPLKNLSIYTEREASYFQSPSNYNSYLLFTSKETFNMSTQSILLQGGTILIHDENDHVQSVKTDLLIEGNTISKIEKDINPTTETEIIDCKDKLISPGFIDTHHHLWQTLLKGRHANEMLLEYFYTGNISTAHPLRVFTELSKEISLHLFTVLKTSIGVNLAEF
jgi:hypothetical protein